MKEIQLTQGKTALVDDKNYNRLNRFKWQAYKNKHTYYAARKITVDGMRIIQTMQSLILEIPEGMEHDHKDRNGLNNQEENIRQCTRQQNNFNRRSKGKIKYKGVSFNPNEKRKNKYSSMIKFNYKAIFIGRFKTEIEAAKSYDKKAKELFKEFAFLNFPE